MIGMWKTRKVPIGMYKTSNTKWHISKPHFCNSKTNWFPTPLTILNLMIFTTKLTSPVRIPTRHLTPIPHILSWTNIANSIITLTRWSQYAFHIMLPAYILFTHVTLQWTIHFTNIPMTNLTNSWQWCFNNLITKDTCNTTYHFYND